MGIEVIKEKLAFIRSGLIMFMGALFASLFLAIQVYESLLKYLFFLWAALMCLLAEFYSIKKYRELMIKLKILEDG